MRKVMNVDDLLSKLAGYSLKPELYAPGTGSLWDDEHISEMMLDVHLEQDSESATRKHDFVDRSVKWIAEIAPPNRYPDLLDLGCGPGVYAERFHKAGYAVTGIDFSRRSIRYAEVQTTLERTNIEYCCMDYMTIDYQERFDIVTLIYCDYAALSITDRCALLSKVYRSLRPGGKFIFDVFTHKMRAAGSRSWFCYDQGGFYSDKPHLCLMSVYQYDDEDKTELRQSVAVTDDSVQCFNVWDHFFDKDELVSEVMPAGFCKYEIYGDVAGGEYSEAGDTICGVFTK